MTTTEAVIVGYLCITATLAGFLSATGRPTWCASLWPVALVCMAAVVPLAPLYLLGKWIGGHL